MDRRDGKDRFFLYSCLGGTHVDLGLLLAAKSNDHILLASIHSLDMNPSILLGGNRGTGWT